MAAGWSPTPPRPPESHTHDEITFLFGFILAALSGAAAGAAVGGITGALIGMGIPEIEARQFEGKIKGGNILLSVHVSDGDLQVRARKILERHGATDIVSVGEESVPARKAS